MSGHWYIDKDTYLEVDTFGNMRQYRNPDTGRCWLVRVEVYAIHNGQFAVEVFVDGVSVDCMNWSPYSSGIMTANRLPVDWSLSNGFDIGWRYVKNEAQATINP